MESVHEYFEFEVFANPISNTTIATDPNQASLKMHTGLCWFQKIIHWMYAHKNATDKKHTMRAISIC